MAVETPQIKINPYQTDIPMVPLTLPEVAPVPQQGTPAYKGKGPGVATIADSMLRGFMQGHAIKEQRKFAQANAAINAGQAAENSAWQTYQDAIVSGKSPDEQKALYDNYAGIYQKNTDTMQQFAVPDKKSKDGQKKPKGEGKDSKDKTPQGQGFGGKLKDFFEANPHLVPQLAILSRSAGMRQPGLSPEGQQKQLQLKAAQQESATADIGLADLQRKQGAQKVYDQFAGLNEQEVAALPPEQQKQFKAAKAILFPPKQAAEKSKIWTNKAGDFISLPENETPPPGSGYAPYEKPSTAGAPKGEEATVISYAQEHNLDPKNIPAEVRKAVHDWYNTKPEQRTETISVPAHLDSNGNWVASSTISMRGAVSGSEPGEPNVPKSQGGITPPPGAAQSPQQVFTRNQAWAKPDWQTQLTKLSPQEEQKFQQWWAQTKAKQPDLTDPDSPTADYDYRGYWKAQQAGDPNAKRGANQHFPDTYKTPYHKTFSKESRYATEGAPSWQGDVLKDSQGNVIADETKKKASGGFTPPPRSAAPKAAATRATGPITPPPGKGTWQQSQNTQRVNTEVKAMYDKAETSYNTAVDKNQAAYSKALQGGQDPKEAAKALNAANQKALEDLNKSKADTQKYYESQVRAVGGTVASDLTVTVPGGKTYTFKDKAAADAFKREAGIQ